MPKKPTKPVTLPAAVDTVLSAHAAGEPLDEPIANLAKARKRYGKIQSAQTANAREKLGRPHGTRTIDQDKIRELSAGGMPAAGIAQKLKCSRETVYAALRDQPTA